LKRFLLPLLAVFGASCTSSTYGRYQGALIQPEPILPGQVVEVTWMGNAGVYVTDHETGFLIDPFVSRYGMLRVGLGHYLHPRLDLVDEWLRRMKATDVKAVLVSHSHYDHALDAPWFAEKTGAVMVGTESTANVARGAGLPEGLIKVVTGGDSMQIGRFKVTFLWSEHGPALFGRVPFPGVITEPLKPPARARQYRMGGVFGIVIEHPSGTLVHHGSAGYRDQMYAGVKADAVMLGLAGRGDTEPYLANVVDVLGAPTVIPIHIDDMFDDVDDTFDFIFRVDFDAFMDVMARKRPKIKVATLPIGVPVRLLNP